jgi:hypothetical protein
MLDGLDENLRLIHNKRARELHTAVWASGYAVGQKGAVSLSELTELESPHLDLVTNFCRRAVAAKVGISCVLLTGPQESLYSARFIDFNEVQMERRHGYRPAGLGVLSQWLKGRHERKLKARDLALACEVEKVNNALLRDGACAKAVKVPLGTCTNGVPNTITVYVMAGRLYRCRNAEDQWGSRAELARQCASMLRPTPSGG